MCSCSNILLRNKTFGRNRIIFLIPHTFREYSPADCFFPGTLLPTLVSSLSHIWVGSTTLPVGGYSRWLPHCAGLENVPSWAPPPEVAWSIPPTSSHSLWDLPQSSDLILSQRTSIALHCRTSFQLPHLGGRPLSTKVQNSLRRVFFQHVDHRISKCETF